MLANKPEQIPDIELVQAAITEYFQGLYHGDLNRLREVFHESARLYGYRDGVFSELALNDWLEIVSTRPVPAENGEPFDMTIESIDLTGEVGNAKVRDLYMGLKFTDYLHLAKIENRWQIVNKTFHHD